MGNSTSTPSTESNIGAGPALTREEELALKNGSSVETTEVHSDGEWLIYPTLPTIEGHRVSICKHDKDLPVPLTDKSELEIWVSGLSDRANVPRKAIIAVLRDALTAANPMCDTFPDMCKQFLNICGGKTEWRALMLRTPFLDGHTPIVWIILNVPDRYLHDQILLKTPPIISGLLDCFESKPPELMRPIYSACCIRNANQLFQFLNPHSRLDASSKEVYTVHLAPHRGYSAINVNSNEFEFTIHDFPVLMLMEGRVDIRFVHSYCLYSIGFAIRDSGSWVFFYRIALDHGERPKKYQTKIIVELEPSKINGRPDRETLLCAYLSRSAKRDFIERDIAVPILQNANPYIGTTQILRGFIRLEK